MSGIAALWRRDGAPARDDLGRMAGALHSLGRDGAQTAASGGIGLAALRARRTPEDLFDRQPVTGAGGRLALVADARLDNRAELARALDIDPARLPRLSDAALLMRALERWGEAALERLYGAYAFVLWDKHEQRMLCARDALGEAPLFYTSVGGLFAAASLPLGLFALPDVPRELDERSLARHLLLLPTQDDAFFAGIARLRPGHKMVVTANDLRVERWWSPPAAGSVCPASEQECAEQGRAMFAEAVEACMRTTAAVGSHLSGGCDSGAVTAFAAEAQARRGARLTAYTSVPREGYDQLGPRRRPGDEGPGAAELAGRHANIDHVLVRTGDATPLDDLDLMHMAQGAPVLNACNMTWMLGIARAARTRREGVILTGQMGNMTLSYDGLQRLPALLGAGRLGTWAREALALARRPGTRWRQPAWASVAPFLPRPLWKRVQALRGEAWQPLEYSALSAAFADEVNIEALAAEAGWDTSYRPWRDGHAMRVAVLERMDLAPVLTALRAATGVEHRDPTMNRRFAEFCLGLPEEWYLHRGETKRLLRLIAGDRLPSRTLDPRQRKGYQGVDWHEGLTRARPALMEELDRLAADPVANRVLDLPRMRRLVTDWPEGGWHSPAVTRAYRMTLLRGIATGRFIRSVQGGNQ